MTGSPGLDIATFNLSSTVLIMSTVCSGGSEVAVRHLREKHTHRLNARSQRAALSGWHSNAHNTDAIEFRCCVSLLGPFARLSIIGIWPLCKQCNSTTNPPIFASLQRDPKEGGASTIHEWKVTQLLLLIQAYLFNLWGKCIVSRWSATNGHIKNRILWHNEEACT